MQREAAALHTKLTEWQEDKAQEFEELYKRIVTFLHKEKSSGAQKEGDSSIPESDDKDPIWNLALLDNITNRSYQNAPFAYKRKTIIEQDMAGIFIPTCTKNLFLKYYTKDPQQTSIWKNRWNHTDRQGYRDEMTDLVKWLWYGDKQTKENNG